MGLIPSSILATARQYNEAAMPSTVTVKRRSLSADSYGGQTATYATAATTTGRIVFVGNNPAYRAVIEGAQLQAHEIYLAAIPYGTGALETDRLIFDGESEYEIVNALNARSYQMGERFLVRYVGAVESAPETDSFFLLETGDYFLLETGDNLVLE